MALGYKLEEYLGKTFNRVTIIGSSENKNNERQWLYRCECGNEKTARPGHLINGTVKSCGCLKVETNLENLKKALLSPLIGRNQTHGMSGTRPHRIWTGMKTRCDNDNVVEYPDYGGRGITYCDKWKTFEGFWEDMREGYSDDLTIDRADTNGNYEKSNCAWEDMSVQAHHRRKRKNSEVSFVGVKKRSEDRYEATFCKNGKVQYLGTYPTEYEAAQAYDDAYEEVYGDRNNKTERKQ